ncbi:MAG: DGQHR domain-containing protein [Parasphingorhabdus sp.]|jgi:DGQHR domain-containing protein|uniref:DGQHR domain-containing protein n=1 Tax=Parasphingorhabdus sp. TaxID=2709688 RepID=UPI0039E2D99B
MNDFPVDPSKIEISFDCIQATQPIGDLFLGSIEYDNLIKFTYFDVRRVVSSERDVERYLGIQRPIHKSRLRDLEAYVNFADATFPTSVIVAINDSRYVSYNSKAKKMTLRNFQIGEKEPSIAIRQLGRVIDGQHRIAGLEAFSGEEFDVSVTIFIEADISDQAHIFSTVNLEQTKVHKNLVYDLYELSRSRSPQKTCHLITVTLDRDPDSPFFERIKRLGFATDGRVFEPVSQATFVEGLLQHMTKDPKSDRDILLRKKLPEKFSGEELYKFPLRNMFIDGKDTDILQVIFNYFEAVKKKWPEAWDERGRGHMLNRTNGVRALLRFFRKAYTKIAAPGDVPTVDKFYDRIFAPMAIRDEHFTVENFVPGTSGESRLFRVLSGQEKFKVDDD